MDLFDLCSNNFRKLDHQYHLVNITFISLSMRNVGQICAHSFLNISAQLALKIIVDSTHRQAQLTISPLNRHPKSKNVNIFTQTKNQPNAKGIR